MDIAKPQPLSTGWDKHSDSQRPCRQLVLTKGNFGTARQRARFGEAITMEGLARLALVRSGRQVKPAQWVGSAWQSENTFHQLSPYIGKTKSSMAASLISRFSKRNDLVYDPFSGCGTFAFEAWTAGRHVAANDLSPYANVLTRAKLFPYHSIEDGLKDLQRIEKIAIKNINRVDLRTVPSWVRQFFHSETLREAIAWSEALKTERRWFLLSCLLGILHHQRPGFLSYPSSHTVPYLRVNKFPKSQFPELYKYRSLRDRLEAKLIRSFRRVPKLDFQLRRRSLSVSADRSISVGLVDAIITSPPYMRQLDYGRDNRLRLWFLGCESWKELDNIISPGEIEFLGLMERCFRKWKTLLKPNGYCVLVVGNECSRESHNDLPSDVAKLAITTVGGYRLISQYTEVIPNDRRVRRGIIGSKSETIIVLKNEPPLRSGGPKR
jgi:hypothetical protein